MTQAAWLRILPSVLLVSLIGCERGGAWEGTVETLPNGALRVTNAAVGVWGDDGGWRLVPELRLGEVEGADATMFTSISGLEVDDAGRIYVLDRQANELRIFDAAGNHVRSTGRSGGGPGEYAAANGLFWLASDSLVVVDQRGGRYSILDEEGRFVRSVRRSLPFYAWAFQGGHVDGVVFEETAIGAQRDQPVLLGTPLAEAPVGVHAVDSPTGDVARAEPPAAPRDTILLPAEARSPEFFEVRTGSGGMMMGVPFSPQRVRFLDGQGTLWSGHGSEFRIVRTTLAGDTLLEILADIQPAAVSDAELDAWRGTDAVARFREMGGDLDMSRVPRRKPFFDDLWVEADGHVWVSLPGTEMEAQFAIFDPEGRYLGRVGATGFRRVDRPRPVIRNDRLYLVGRDDLDVQRVYVYRIDRSVS